MSVGPQNFDIRFHVAWTKQLTFWHAQYWFPREMPPEDQAQKFHADEVSSPRSGGAVPGGTIASTNQKHQPDLSSDTSSVWNFSAHFSDITSRGNQWRRRKMSAVFSG